MENQINFQQPSNYMHYSNQQWYNDIQNLNNLDHGLKFKQTKFDNFGYYQTPTNAICSTVYGSPIDDVSEKIKQYNPCMQSSEYSLQRGHKEKTDFERGYYVNTQSEIKYQDALQPGNAYEEYYKRQKMIQRELNELAVESKELKSDFTSFDQVQNNYQSDYDDIQRLNKDSGFCENSFPVGGEQNGNSCEGSLTEGQKVEGSSISSLPIYPWMAGGVGN